ncbi:MAG: DNA polymerase III subunit delta [Phycisphaerae bacterium]
MAKSPAKPPALPPVIILAGEELFLRNQHLADIQQQLFQGQDPGMGLVRLDPASLGGSAMATVLDEARTASMFNPKKLTIVDPADPLLKKTDSDDDGKLSNREILENYVESATEAASATGGSAESILVLVFNSWLKTTRLHKSLDKIGAVKWAEPIKEHQTPAWIQKRAKDAYAKTIDPPAANLLADLIGPDLQRLDNELAKLSLYQPDNPAITTAAVSALVGFQHEQQIWDMINALASKDAPTALKKIDELWALDPKIEYTATGAVFVWLHQVLKARELIDRRLPDAAIGKELKIWPPDRAQKVLSLAREWGLDGAARWSDAMLRMDLANKSSLGEPRRNLEKFVVELCADDR